MQFIDSIYENNDTSEGIEKLYNQLSSVETKIWDDITSQNITNWVEVFLQKVKQFGENIVIIEANTNKQFTYNQLDITSEKIKDFILHTTDQYHIGLNYQNSFLFMAALIGINKAGRLAILFNNREPDSRREELSKDSNTTIVLGNSITGCKNFCIESIVNSKESYKKNYEIKETSLDDPAFVIFTSGTTGKSKGALFSHRRMLGAGIAWSLRTGMSSDDNCYIPLPLYHGNALAVAFSSVIFSGSCSTLKVKFSVSSFWNDIEKFNCTHMVYIGELWRYILNRYQEKKDTSLKVIFGNGLTKQLWDDVVDRFNIKHVVEHFGSTEMPAGALTNWFNIHGFCGYLPPHDPRLNEMVLVDDEYKVVKYGEYGQALFLVPSGKYRGYCDSTLDEAKLYRDLFKKDDLWWKSGDLLKSQEDGFFTFIERLGDTYRYKGENVACVDVEQSLRDCYEFDEVVVYGVTLANVDGKIGMASLVIEKPFDPNSILDTLKMKLANYAMPYIIKLEDHKHQTTSTLKIQKTHLAKKGFSEYKTKPHFIFFDGKYEVLNDTIAQKLSNGELGL